MATAMAVVMVVMVGGAAAVEDMVEVVEAMAAATAEGKAEGMAAEALSAGQKEEEKGQTSHVAYWKQMIPRLQTSVPRPLTARFPRRG